MRIDFTVPKNTPQSAPLSQSFVFMQAPEITREQVTIEKGHAFLTGLQIYAGGRFFHVLPEAYSGVDWMTGDGVTIDKHIRIVLEAPRFMVELRGYNLDQVFPHTFRVDLD